METLRQGGNVFLRNRQEWVILLLLLACYVYFLPRFADWSQSSRTALILAIVNEGRLEIDTYASLTGDYAEVNGHRYSDKAPGPALLGVPAYAVTKAIFATPAGDRLLDRLAQGEAFRTTIKPGEAPRSKVEFALAQAIATWTVISIPAALLGVGLFRLLRNVTDSRLIQLLVTLVYGLATSAFPYSGALYSHQLVAVLLFTSFALLWQQTQPGPWRLAIVGLFLGTALISEYPAALIVGGIGLYTLSFARRLTAVLTTSFWIGVGMMPPLLLMAAHNLTIFGTPAPVGYNYSTLWQEEHHTGFFSLSVPTFEAFWGITFSPYRGIFLISPILLVGLIGLVLLVGRSALRREAILCLWCVASFFLFNSSSVMWSGGYGVGPRYLVPILPFLAIGIAVTLDRWRTQVAAWVVVSILVVWSFVATWSLTIGGQSFPTYDQYPLMNLSWPALAAGNVARNLGTFLGLSGWWSLGPLLAIVAASLVALVPGTKTACPSEHRASAVPAPHEGTPTAVGA